METSANWPSLELDNWKEFASHAATISEKARRHPSYFFRGQPDAAWELTSRLLRTLPPGTSTKSALDLEQLALDEFRSQAHLHYDPANLPATATGDDLIEWWALMQHHGAPTRLLDWTTSVYVAAYFAVESVMDKAGAVFVVHAASASRTCYRALGNPPVLTTDQARKSDAPAVALFTSPRRKSQRLAAQQGQFSLSPLIDGHHDRIITASCAEALSERPGMLALSKWIVPSAQKRDFLHHLREMNITANTLFPGLEGLGRAVTELVQTGPS